MLIDLIINESLWLVVIFGRRGSNRPLNFVSSPGNRWLDHGHGLLQHDLVHFPIEIPRVRNLRPFLSSL